VSKISPNSAPAGALAFTLTVNGSNFLSGSQVSWNGNARTTTFISSSQLQAHIMAADLTSAGKVNVTVVNPAPGGGSSGAATFTIVADTVVFQSSRALDGSDAADTNFTANIWVMNPDGTGATALTKLTAALADSGGPVWLRDGSKIAFASSRALDDSDAVNAHSTLNIWIMNSDGSGATPVTKLTAAATDCDAPLWSPDGSKILFQSARALDSSDVLSTNKVKNIWVVNSDGSGAIPLTKTTVFGSDNMYPVWSPDGNKIVFFSHRALDGSDARGVNDTGNIWLMNADGSGAKPLTKLTAVGAHSEFPTWTPDGSKIVFLSLRALDGSDAATLTANVWLMNADGSGAVAVTRLTGSSVESAEGATASPDGTRIAFASKRALDGSDAVNTNLTTNIWVVNADGSGATPLTRITAIGAYSVSPVWSPGGTQVFFSSQRALDGSDATNIHSTPNIWVVNADGSGATPLTKITAQSAGSEAPQLP
jgi:Tol biopolymer transport system component